MEAPTTQEQIKAAYKNLYQTTANVLDAQRDVNAARNAFKDAEATLTTSEAVQAGKNAETRTAILFSMTAPERAEVRHAEDTLSAAERELALAKISVNELRELLRLAEYERTVEWPTD